MKIKKAINFMLILVVAVTIFHLAILLRFIPYEITWGGRLENDSEMYVFETASLIINFILGLTLLIKGKHVKQIVSIKVVHVILWVFFFLFALNTIGNIFAETNFEKSFTVLTLLSAILIWIILKAKDPEPLTIDENS